MLEKCHILSINKYEKGTIPGFFTGFHPALKIVKPQG
jgi:hypothetical protein